jgi:hypothetical protein
VSRSSRTTSSRPREPSAQEQSPSSEQPSAATHPPSVNEEAWGEEMPWQLVHSALKGGTEMESCVVTKESHERTVSSWDISDVHVKTMGVCWVAFSPPICMSTMYNTLVIAIFSKRGVYFANWGPV